MRLWHLAWSMWKPILPRPLTAAEYALTGTEIRFRRRKPSQLERCAMMSTSYHARGWPGAGWVASVTPFTRAKPVPGQAQLLQLTAKRCDVVAADADFRFRSARSWRQSVSCATARARSGLGVGSVLLTRSAPTTATTIPGPPA